MHAFVTGATGFIGSTVATEWIDADRQVLGLDLRGSRAQTREQLG